MAQVKIDLSLQDQSSSIKKRTSEVQNLNKELTKSQQLATGTRTGSGAVKASYSAASESTAYGQARGSMGATGASGRDFANQAQGLGGLVRLYATYAANVFAVSAAFTALSQAMNTTNMVQGLNQLGAASGIAMGNLAKQFADASGGAISFRESMEATAKAVSSGMSQAQFLKLGEVAKKASQALGIGMSDAVSRLTRGITKLEPELLDELGIFTKVGKATEDYARSVGKSAIALTDFERRQAFANAVLAEGAQKFGEIDIPTNPYDKLLASLKNVAQQILEVVNKGLTPLVNILSASPGALLAAIAAIAVKITTQALPAITQYREGLKKAAEESQALAKLRSEAAKEAYNRAAEPAMQKQLEIRAEAYLRKEEALSKLVEKSERASSSGRLVKEFRDIMATKDVALIKDEDIAKIDVHGKSLKRSTNLYTEWAREATAAKKAAREFDIELEKKPDVTKSKLGSAADIALRREASAARKAQSTAIISQASIDTEVDGARAAFKKMYAAIDTEQLGKTRAVFTGISGSISILTTKVLGLAAAFGNAFAVVGVLITAYNLITGIFGKNAKEAEKAKSSLDALEGSIDSVTATIDRLNKKPILESLTPQALAAKGTAFSNLATSLTQALDDVEKEIQSRNVVDSFANWISGIFGKNTEERLAAQIADVIDGAFKTASTATQAEDVRKYMALSLSIPVDSTLEQIKTAAKKAGPQIQKELAKTLETIGKAAERSSGSVKAFVDSLAESSKLAQDLSTSFKQTDPLSKFAEDSSKKLMEFSKVLDSADLPSKLALLSATSTDTRFLQLLPLDQAKQILAVSSDLKQINLEIAQGLGDIRALEDGRLAAQQKLDNTSVNSPIVPQLKEAVRQYDLLIDKARQAARATETRAGLKLQDAEAVFNKALTAGLIANIDRFQSGLELGAKKARLELEKTNLQGVVDPIARIDKRVALETKAISLDNEQIRAQVSLIEATDKLRLAVETQTYQDNVSRAMDKFGVKTEAEARARDPQLDRQFRTLEVSQAIQAKSTKELQAMLGAKGGVSADVLGAVQGALPTAQARDAAAAKQAENKIKASQIRLGGEFEKIDAGAKAASDQYDKMLTQLDLRKETMTAAEYATEKAGIQQGKALVAPAAEFRRAQLAGGTENIKLAEDRFALESATAQTVYDRALTSAQELESLKQASSIYKTYFADQSAGLDVSAKDLEYKQQALQQDLVRGKITEDQFNSSKYLLDVEQAGLTRSNALLAEQEKYTNTILDIRTKIAEVGGIASPEQLRALKEAGEANIRNVDSIDRQYVSTTKLLDLNKELSTRQKAYADVFKASFDSMADAMVDWAKTGKWAGKELFTSLMGELLRYELRLQTTSLYGAARTALLGGGNSMGWTGYGTGVTPTVMMGDISQEQFVAASGGRPFAKGGAFDHTVEAFAQGGAFTNSIVDSPTMFKFAKGTGLMGEAGPEAIMPLKRDSQGNLGVRAGGNSGGNTEVVVNNYSNQQAQAKETVDSRGNRRIEVVVGEMSAADINKPGSTSQQAMAGTYGIKPRIIRR